MDPGSALILALVSAWYMTRSAAEAAVDQARAEARAAGSAIRDDLRQRGQTWADDLAARLASGRSGGPFTGLWWGWAGLRAFQAVRRALRGGQDPDGPQPIRGPRGPFGRIWDAGTRGARFARDERRRQRTQDEQRTRVPVGVCGRCRAVVARTALAPAATPSGVVLQMCATCRAATQAQRDRAADADRPRPESAPATDVVDADVVVGEPARIAAPRPELGPGAAPTSPAAPAQPADRPPKPAPTPAVPRPAQPPVPAAASPAPPTAVPRAPQTAQIEGEPMAPRNPGQIVPARRSALPVAAQAAARDTGGESYTHGQWQRSVADIEKRLDELPTYLELMLRRLTTADAGRSQVQGVVNLHDAIHLYVTQLRDMLTRVNQKELPVLRAVENAGGPDEIAGIPYLSDV